MEYICEECGGQFHDEDDWSDEEAMAESVANFGEVGLAIICDDCYNSVMH